MAKSIITDTNIDPVLLKQSKPAFNNYVQKSFIEKYRDHTHLLTEVSKIDTPACVEYS
jgi:hypothetical protein